MAAALWALAVAVLPSLARGAPIGNTNVLELHSLDDPDAVCLAGHPAGVYAYTGGSSKQWVVQLGASSAGLSMCLDPARCELMAQYLAKSNQTALLPMLTGAPNVSLMMGIQSQNCTENPDFCGFNQAQIMMCDYAMLMSDGEAVGPKNNTRLHFRGLRILKASLAKLAQLGLQDAESVLLTGVSHGGTAVFMHADRIGAWLKELAPGLKVYKALPVDGIHPKHWEVQFWPQYNATHTWCDSANHTAPCDVYSTALLGGPLLPFQETTAGVYKTANMSGGLHPGCLAAAGGSAAAAGKCLYVNETLPYVKTPTFAVNQMASIWDTQCNLAGQIYTLEQGVSAMLQIACIVGKSDWHICFQYSDRCSADQVAGVIAPFQRQYVAEYAPFAAQAGNGGFIHSCHLGAYWVTEYQKAGMPASTSIWNIISVKGVTMREAVGAWWRGSASAEPGSAGDTLTTDCVWSGSGKDVFCNPVCNGFPYY